MVVFVGFYTIILKVFQHRANNASGGRGHENAELIIDLIQFFIEGDVSL